MSKAAKRWLAIAGILFILGSILFVGVLARWEWDFTKLSTVSYIKNTYTFQEDFKKIFIHVQTTEVELIPTEEGACTVICMETEKERHNAIVQNDTLVIDTTDTRQWYDYIGISFGTSKITVYLPQREYDTLLAETHTGDIILSKDLSFKNLKIQGDTADVECLAAVLGNVDMELSTGDIKLEAVAGGQINLATSTGDIKVCSATVKKDVELKTDTGDILLENVVAKENLSIKTNTGDVRLKGCDASQIFAYTDTGDVTGTLLSPKVFVTETSAGRIRVPKTTSGGRCEINTSTGDIKIEIAS